MPGTLRIPNIARLIVAIAIIVAAAIVRESAKATLKPNSRHIVGRLTRERTTPHAGREVAPRGANDPEDEEKEKKESGDLKDE